MSTETKMQQADRSRSAIPCHAVASSRNQILDIFSPFSEIVCGKSMRQLAAALDIFSALEEYLNLLGGLVSWAVNNR